MVFFGRLRDSTYGDQQLSAIQGETGDTRAALLVDLFDNTSDLVQLIDIEGRIELVNRAWCETLGISETEAIGTNVFSLIASDCHEHCKLLFQELLCQTARQRIECAFLARSGQRIELEGQLDVSCDNGVPVRVRGILRNVTARRAAERELRLLNTALQTKIRQGSEALVSSEARLREAQAVAKVGHWTLDLSTGAMHWSDEICRLCGFDPAIVEPDFQTFLERVHPEDRQLLVEHGQEIHTLAEPIQYRFRLLLDDGELRHIQARVITHYDTDGRAVYAIGTSQDITDLVTFQQQLEESSRRLTSLVDLSPLGIGLIGPGGSCLQKNASFDLLSRSVKNTRWEQIRLEALASDSLSSNRLIAVDLAEGKTATMRVLTQKVPEAITASHPGQLVWMMLEDISEQREKEQRLRQAANVFRYAEEGIMVTDINGTIIDVNAAFTTLTGYAYEELIGANPRLLKSGQHDEAFYNRMWEQLQTNGNWRGEVINRTKDGSLHEMLETISSVKDEEGNVSHYVALLSDIRQIKLQQHQLEQLAHFDPLTGLANRHLLFMHLERLMTEADRSGNRIAVCFIDLDGFKTINDSLGHDAGDHLLKLLAARMRKTLRNDDLLTRLGGDEFVAILSSAQSPATLSTVLERLLETLAEPASWNQQAMRVTASIGVSLYPSCGGPMGAEQLLRHADHAMYDAKRNGKNSYAFQEGSDLTQA